MGINGLHKLLRDKGLMRLSHIKKFRGKRVAADGYSWLHKSAYGCAADIIRGTKPWEARGAPAPYVTYCFNLLNMMKANGVIPMVVFDGDRLPAKAHTMDKRREARRANLERAQRALEAGDKEEAHIFMQRAVHVTADMVADLIAALRVAGIEFVVAPYEADAQMAALASKSEAEGGVSAVITEDSDLLCYNAIPSVLFKVERSGGCLEVRREDLFGEEEAVPAYLLESAPLNASSSKSQQSDNADSSLSGSAHIPVKPLFPNWDHKLFIGMCVFAGCDFLEEGVKGLGPVKALKLINKYRNLDRVLWLIKRDKSLKVPPNFDEMFYRAFYTFMHARVYDSSLKALRPLRELPAELEGPEVDTRFLGPDMEPAIAQGIAEGRIDPTTREPVSARSASIRNPANQHPARRSGDHRSSDDLQPYTPASSQQAASTKTYTPPCIPPPDDHLPAEVWEAPVIQPFTPAGLPGFKSASRVVAESAALGGQTQDQLQNQHAPTSRARGCNKSMDEHWADHDEEMNWHEVEWTQSASSTKSCVVTDANHQNDGKPSVGLSSPSDENMAPNFEFVYDDDPDMHGGRETSSPASEPCPEKNRSMNPFARSIPASDNKGDAAKPGSRLTQLFARTPRHAPDADIRDDTLTGSVCSNPSTPEQAVNPGGTSNTPQERKGIPLGGSHPPKQGSIANFFAPTPGSGKGASSSRSAGSQCTAPTPSKRKGPAPATVTIKAGKKLKARR